MYIEGVFTTLFVRNGLIHNLESHLLRLERNCREIESPFPKIDRQLLVKRINRPGEWRLRLKIINGEFIEEIEPYRRDLAKAYRLTIYPKPIIDLRGTIKIWPYNHRDVIYDFALLGNKDDVLTTTKERFVLETAYANLFWVYKNQMYVPDPQLNYFFGITLSRIVEFCEVKKIIINYVQTKPENIPSDANIYLCNSLRGVAPVLSIDQIQYKRNFEREVFLRHILEKALQV